MGRLTRGRSFRDDRLADQDTTSNHQHHRTQERAHSWNNIKNAEQAQDAGREGKYRNVPVHDELSYAVSGSARLSQSPLPTVQNAWRYTHHGPSARQ